MTVDDALARLISHGSPKTVPRKIYEINASSPDLLPALLTRLKELTGQSIGHQSVIAASIVTIEQIIWKRLTPGEQILASLTKFLDLDADDQTLIQHWLLTDPINDDPHSVFLQNRLATRTVDIREFEAVMRQLVTIATNVQLATVDRHRACQAALAIFERLLQVVPPIQPVLKCWRWFYHPFIEDRFSLDQALSFYQYIANLCEPKNSWTTIFDLWVENFATPPALLSFLPLLGLCRWANQDIDRIIGLIGYWSAQASDRRKRDQSITPLLAAILNDTDLTRWEPPTETYSIYRLFGQALGFSIVNELDTNSWSIIAALKRFLYHCEGDSCVILLALLLNALSRPITPTDDDQVVTNRAVALVRDLIVAVKGSEGGDFWVQLAQAPASAKMAVIKQPPPLKNLADLIVFQPIGELPFILTPAPAERFIPSIPQSSRLDSWLEQHRDLLINFGNLLINGQPGEPGLRHRRREIAQGKDIYLVDDPAWLGLGLTEIICEPGNRAADEIARLGWVFQTHTLIRHSLRFTRQLGPEGVEEWVLPDDDPALNQPHGLIYTLVALSYLHDLLVESRSVARGVARRRHPQTGGPATLVSVDKDVLVLQTRPYWLALPARGPNIPAMLPEQVADVIAKEGRMPKPPILRHHQPWPPADQPKLKSRKHKIGRLTVAYDCPVGWAYVRQRAYRASRPQNSSLYPRHAYVQGANALSQLSQLWNLTMSSPL